MMFLKISSVLFLILALLLAVVLTSILRWRYKSLNVADVALPLYAFAIFIVSSQTFVHSLLPLYGLLLSLLLLGVTFYFFRVKKSFSYRRIFKLFWRLSFLFTFLFYLALVIYLLALV
ncbi:DUF3397 family protein [Streptococcus ovuberis]|uniref:DUF3397 domain-containing protein n=1 Tax=Streptococcus ovuberis TaxID=1936207 RepID=A0A7X6MWQ0_9STRE|nr:DUF3397 family protein [Streptococcus ovuberis]NKZ19780.1 DUF3397 domain-containing protein [Streptococcus ovuberis]